MAFRGLRVPVRFIANVVWTSVHLPKYARYRKSIEGRAVPSFK